MALLGLAAGGLLGTFARYFVSSSISKYFPNFPFGTMAVNLLGCALAGYFAVLAADKSSLKLFLLTGFCGAFTTFSALILESADLFRTQGLLPSLANVAVSFLLGFAFLAAGFWAAGFARP